MAFDEFYTQLKDIENELRFYDFQNKIVYCPCDNYELSQFAVYFSQNFQNLKLKKLICSCFYPSQTSFFDDYKKGFWVEFDGVQWSNKNYFKSGNGDFRTAECTELKERADVIVTNPPFSIFIDFFFWVKNKKFITLFSQISLLNNKLFESFKNGECWLGKTSRTHGLLFYMPNYVELHDKRHGKIENGVTFCNVSGSRWLTNFGVRKEKDLILTENFTPDRFPFLDGTQIINVDKKGEIPKDYFKEIAVPISFFNYYNPAQFEILRKIEKPFLKGVLKNTRIVIKRIDSPPTTC